MKMTSLLVAALALVMLGSTVANAEEMDLSKALVGKWEGEMTKGPKDKAQRNNARTLVIGQVRKQDGKWIVEDAKWGVTGQELGPIEVTLEVNGGVPTLQFQHQSENARGGRTGTSSAKLSLNSEGVLAGTLHLGGVGPSNEPIRPVKLKKME